MKLACVQAVAELAQRETSTTVTSLYPDHSLSFGPTYIIPKPFDPRLLAATAPRVAEAAAASRGLHIRSRICALTVTS